MPKNKKKVRSVKSSGFKLSKDVVIGVAIGAIILFVICLMMTPKV